MKKYQIRFIVFCFSKGKTPEQFFEENKIEYGDGGPDGCNMLEFILWIGEQWRDYFKSFKIKACNGWTESETRAKIPPKDFDDFLIKKYNYVEVDRNDNNNEISGAERRKDA